jgi:phosphate-selective porin
VRLAFAALLSGLLPGGGTAQIPLKAYYADDFILETEDGAFQLRLRGNLHLDTRLYRAEELGAVQNFDIRRARIDFMGRIHRRFTFRIQPELSGSPYIRNAWADLELNPALHLKWGQMKVPFSSSWLTQDNNLNFVERGTAGPVHPFFDRGFTLWGELLDGRVAYDLGVFTGVGTDADVSSGDIDSDKEWAARLFLRPFMETGSVFRGLTLVLGGTWAGMSVPTDRYETRGLRAADYGTAVWRWGTEQQLGTNGRVTDRVAATVDRRRRIGGELHWLAGPFVFSTELLDLEYRDVAVFHDLWVGSKRVVHAPLQTRSGAIRSWSSWVSWYPAGETKRLADSGWKTARPEANRTESGAGAWEVLARYSRTVTDADLFDTVDVLGFGDGVAQLPTGYDGPLPGAGARQKIATLVGAHEVHEATVGVNWTVNPMVRVQLNNVFLWTPSEDRDGDGVNDNLLLSGSFTAQADPDVRGRGTRWENAVLLRLVFKI